MFGRMTFLVAIVVLAQASGHIALAEEKTESASLQVVAVDSSAINLTAEDLKNLPRTSVEVVDRSGKKINYSGVAVHQILAKVNAPLGEELRGAALRCYVAVKAKDEYRAVYALCEFDPAYTDRTILLVDDQDGKPLGEDVGPFQIIVPDEKRHSRWVRQVVRIRIMESRVFDEDAPTTP